VPSTAKRRNRTQLAVRYVLPGVIALGGVVVLIFNHSINGVEGFAMFIGVAGSILLLNVLYRVGVSGDAERDSEEAARTYFDEHGRWPDDE
jgi:low temperature requirement protein LtrA